jgi:SAM-dependent methyltransferase
MTQILPDPSATLFPGLDLAPACPNCGAGGLRPFYSVDAVPAHSCLLMPSRQRALSYPTGRLHLAHCESCGFITNTAFDPNLLDYGQDYEETQGFSPTFRSFATRLARDLIKRFDLRDRSALEIGCGKGEFLAALVENGMAAGVGIDPAYIEGRLRSPCMGRLSFIRDFYSRDYASLAADAVVCRHTLEHIAPTQQFLTELRHAIGDRRDTTIIFELPETLRVLREGAFWDMYHEHCSYFTPGSLARLFRSCGFDVTDLWLEYADQYILLAAKPADGPTQPRLELENDLGETANLVDFFESHIHGVLDHWRDTVRNAAAEGRRVAIWGSGSKGVSFLTTLGLRDEIAAVVDINPHKHGRFMPGTAQEIVGPHRLRDIRPDLVIVMNPVYTREISEQLASMGLHPEIVAV